MARNPAYPSEKVKNPLKTLGNRYAPTRNISTIAGALNTNSILDGLNEVDPQRLSNIFPRFYDEVSKITKTLSTKGNPGNSSGAAGNDKGGQTPTSGVKELVTDALTGALSILVKRYGYGPVLVSFTLPLFTNFDDLLEDYKEMVKDSLMSLYISVLLYGEKNLPVSIIPEIVFGDNIPSNVVTTIPDFYVQVYYTEENDPYPGYVEYEGPNQEKVYLLRTSEYLPFDNLEQEVYTNAETGLATDLSPYIVSITLTVPILNELLEKYCNQVADTTEDKAAGKNSGNSTDLVSMLGPILGGAINQAKTSHLPNSFLDNTKMNKLLNNATKEHNVLKNVIEKYANLAMKPNSKSKNMSNNLNNTTFSVNQIKDESLTHLSRMSGNPNTEVAEIDLEDFKAKAEELDVVFNDVDIAKLLNFVKEIV
jgi:hypothetical protein